MSEAILNLLKEELHRTSDKSKFVDRVLGVLSGDSRCPSELIRQVQSTHDTAIPLSPVATPASISEYEPDARAITADKATPAQNIDRHIKRSAPHTRGDDEATAHAETEKIAQRKRRHTQNDTIDRRNVKKPSPAPLPTATSSKPRQISTKTGGKFRGPGRREKTPAPDFKDERFTNISAQLRREIADYNLTNGFQDAWKVVDGLRWQNPGTAKVDTSLSRIQALQRVIQHCDISDAKLWSLPTLSTIKQRFFVVQLMAEYQKAARNNPKGENDILKTFQREIYPEQSSEQRRKSWDYFRRTAWPLFKAVQRYGYGVLIFPLRNVTMKSLHCLRRESISHLIDYIKICHPDIDIVLNGVSGFLARLLTWGLPPFRLPFSDIAYEDLTASQDHLGRNLFMLAGSTNSEPAVILEEILPWQYPLIDGDLADDSRLQEEDTKLVSRCEDEDSAPMSEAFEATFDWDKAVKFCVL